MQTLPVIKIELAGTVTSFRYPHFTQGVHPTFEMPPPSTIYGHLCSTVGDWIKPEMFRFGYHFTHAGKFVDHKEHLHFSDPIQPFPFDRELLFEPRLTLYITPPEAQLLNQLRNPHYAVVLGRSQDLMTYLSVKVVELQPAAEGYFEHTLLPLEFAPHLERGTIAVTMARYVDPRRRPQWDSYLILKEAAIWPPPRQTISDWDSEEDNLIFEGRLPEFEMWTDPYSPSHRKFPTLKRLVYFHSFMEA